MLGWQNELYLLGKRWIPESGKQLVRCANALERIADALEQDSADAEPDKRLGTS